MTPRVSIVLTAYNRAHSIGRTIESILGQEFGDFDLVISDDASQDGTEEVCRRYAASDARVRYFRNAANIGMPGNLNAGIARSAAPLIANLHDGDIYRPNLLRKWKDALDRNPDAAFVFNALDVLDQHGRWVQRKAPALPERIEVGELVRYMISDEHCFDSPVWGTVMGRRDVYAEVGGFDPRFSFIADVAMWLRLNLRYPVAYVPDALIQLTPHEADRPYAYVNWALERSLMTMYDEAVDGLLRDDPVTIARERRRLRRRRDRRWLWFAGSSLRRSRLDLVGQGLAIFRQEDSLLLRAAGYLGVPLLGIRRAFPWVDHFIRWIDRSVRGRRSDPSAGRPRHAEERPSPGATRGA
jgi:glycosyltransferase involved in cell wall biosynthesis